MDRSAKWSFKLAMLLVAFGWTSVPSNADIQFLPPAPPPAVPKPGENYPESRFGSPPMRVDLGMEVNRSPAGVEEEERPQIKDPKPSAVSRTGVQEVALIASDLGFFPKAIFVTRDIPVRMFVTGASKKPLCIMMDSFQVRRQVRAQQVEEINFTPTSPGQYRFYCPVNGMEGTLLVKELTTITQQVERSSIEQPSARPQALREKE